MPASYSPRRTSVTRIYTVSRCSPMIRLRGTRAQNGSARRREAGTFKVEEGPATEMGILCGPEGVQRIPVPKGWNPHVKAVELGHMVPMIGDMANRFLAEADAERPHP